MQKNPVVHFEMPYKNPGRVTKFYKSVFGWEMQGTGKDMGDYIVGITTEVDKKTNRPKEPGAINGGFYDMKRSKYKEPSVVISVANIEKTVLAVKKAGGKIIGKPQNIPGIGLWVSFKDTEGNRVSLLQALMK